MPPVKIMIIGLSFCSLVIVDSTEFPSSKPYSKLRIEAETTLLIKEMRSTYDEIHTDVIIAEAISQRR
jgi:hypothetical protein